MKSKKTIEKGFLALDGPSLGAQEGKENQGNQKNESKTNKARAKTSKRKKVRVPENNPKDKNRKESEQQNDLQDPWQQISQEVKKFTF
jgi:hypothetical protein